MALNRRHFLATAAAGIGQPLVSVAQIPWENDFSGFILDGLVKTSTPGLSVAIVVRGHTIMVQGYGFADIDNRRSATADTVFHIASVSKTVTATVIMMLCQAGKFALDDPVNRYLDFKVIHPKFPETAITFRHLMTHTSGILDELEDEEAMSPVGDLSLPVRDLLVNHLTTDGKFYMDGACFNTEPGKAWKYSNFGAALLGYLVGRFGSELEPFSHQSLFDPLGMRNTSWTPSFLSAQNLAVHYDLSGGRPLALQMGGGTGWAAGSLRTSASDFARFLAIYTLGGTLNGRTYLKPETFGNMLAASPVELPPRAVFRQGLIWQLQTLDGYHLASHHGGVPGMSTVAAVDLDHHTAVLAFANASGNPNFMAFQNEMVGRLLDRAKMLSV